jgi:hypothetical protein
MANDQLLSEIERQRKYLGELPENFEFPLFNVRHAVESQRASGYRHTAAAAREMTDNALEAGARNIHVVFDTDMESGRKAVSAIAFIDDGSGMIPDMIRYALTWGGGTHFENSEFIGKFGFGLPNASINQTRRVEVYSRADEAEQLMRAVLDITSVSKFGVQSIPAPEQADLPEFVAAYLERRKITLAHGTVVVWHKPDRLTYKRPASLKDHLVDDFAVTYRYLLKNPVTNPDGINLVVEGVAVGPVDPLFLMPGARYYLPEGEGGAIAKAIPVVVRYFRDEETGETHLAYLKDQQALADAARLPGVIGTIYVTVARFAPGFAAERAINGTDENSTSRFEIRKSHRGMSFVRAGREIQTVDLFPRSAKDKASGLGDWPLLQAYAYHWGIEVKFGPELDDVFGITNDKQAVRPMEDFWRVMAQAEVDAAARAEQAWQTRERAKPKSEESSETPTGAEAAAKAAGVATNQRPEVPDRSRETARGELDKAAGQTAGASGGDLEEARRALAEQARQRPYHVTYEDMPNGPWFTPEYVGQQIVVKVNRQHRFYQVVYGDLQRTLGTARLKEAIEILLITLAKSELTIADEEMAVFAENRRRFVDSPFLEAALANLAASVEAPEDMASDEESGSAAA